MHLAVAYLPVCPLDMPLLKHGYFYLELFKLLVEHCIFLLYCNFYDNVSVGYLNGIDIRATQMLYRPLVSGWPKVQTTTKIKEK